jgi:hypothetical protein
MTSAGAIEASEKLRKFHAEQQAKKIVGNLWDENRSERLSEGPEIDAKPLN